MRNVKMADRIASGRYSLKKKNKHLDRMIKQLSRGDVSFSSCREENWKSFVLLEHLRLYNFVHRETNIKLRANWRNIVGQQLATMLGVVASVYTLLKLLPVSNIGHQIPITCNNMQQGMQTDPTCNIQQWCVRLHGASDVCRGSPVTLQLTFWKSIMPW